MASDALVVPPSLRRRGEGGRSRSATGGWSTTPGRWRPTKWARGIACQVERLAGPARAIRAMQAVEFGVTDPGRRHRLQRLARRRRFDDSYSIEVWIKPSHYHVGAVVSLIGEPDTPDGRDSARHAAGAGRLGPHADGGASSRAAFASCTAARPATTATRARRATRRPRTRCVSGSTWWR